jgi:hypothetical protein
MFGALQVNKILPSGVELSRKLRNLETRRWLVDTVERDPIRSADRSHPP